MRSQFDRFLDCLERVGLLPEEKEEVLDKVRHLFEQTRGGEIEKLFELLRQKSLEFRIEGKKREEEALRRMRM